MEILPDELTERDAELLHLLGRCGVMKLQQAKIVYGNVSKYHLRRIEKLSRLGMLVREKGYIRPTSKGLRASGYSGKIYRLSKRCYEERALAVDLLPEFSCWTVEFGIELKRKGLVHRSSHLSALISNNGLKYAVYILAHNPRPATVRFLRAEMRDLRLSGIDRVVVFYTSPGADQAFGSEPPDDLRECCLLPYPSGVSLFKRVFSPEFRSFLNRRFPGLSPCARPFAHFEWRGSYVTILTHNDLVKRFYLMDYLARVQKREGRRCLVVCSPDQAQDYQIPNVEVILDESG